MLRRCLTVLVLALAWSAPLASAKTTPVTLLGHAYYGGGPAPGIRVFPARNLRVTLEVNGHPLASVDTNSNGVFVFRLRPGIYQLNGNPIGSPKTPKWCVRTVRVRPRRTTFARMICGTP
jgi:hypothetical protein